MLSKGNTSGEPTGPPRRDLRLDFIRGAAIIVVLIDHIESHLRVSFVKSWTPISLGFSDVSEIFVFVSGCAFGLVYSRVADKHGWGFAEKKALRRTFQLYLTYVVATWLILLGTAVQNPQLIVQTPRTSLWEAFLLTPTLSYHLFGFEILALYIVLLPFMPLLLRVYSQRAALGWLISGGVYLSALNIHAILLPRLPSLQEWYFNPFSWQFLFFLGMTWGVANKDVERADPPVNPFLLTGAIFVLAFGLWRLKIYPRIGLPASLETPAVHDFLAWLKPVLHKTRLGPLRLLHFFSLAYVARTILPRHAPLWNSPAFRPVVSCGQYALFLYAAGLLLVHSAPTLVNLIGGVHLWSVLLLDFDALLMTLGLAYLLQNSHRFGRSRIRTR